MFTDFMNFLKVSSILFISVFFMTKVGMWTRILNSFYDIVLISLLNGIDDNWYSQCL